MSSDLIRENIRVYGKTSRDGIIPGLRCAQCHFKGSYWYSGLRVIDNMTFRTIRPLFDYGKSMAGTFPAPACSDECAVEYFFRCVAVRRLRGEEGVGETSQPKTLWPTIDVGRSQAEYDAKERDISIS